MPILTDKYPHLEHELIALIKKNLEHCYGEQYDYPIFDAAMSDLNGPVISCQVNSIPEWISQLEPMLEEVCQFHNIPMLPGAERFVEIKGPKYIQQKHSHVNLNINPIELERLLQKESALYREQEWGDAVYRTAYPRGLNNFLKEPLINAIKKTLLEREGYPVAHVAPDASFCVTCLASDPNSNLPFHNLYLLFADICEKYGIELLPDATEYASQRIPAAAQDLIKYEFHINPRDMENLLIHECDEYAAYKQIASITRLADPSQVDMKEGMLCLFPLMALGEDQYLLRSAGCNMSEIVSVQLANYIKKYLLSNDDVPLEKFFGHHISSLTKETLNINEKDIFTVIMNILDLKELLNHQTDDGTRVLDLADERAEFVKEMSEETMSIHQRLGVVSPDELVQLKSCEVPIDYFLEQLERHREKIETLKNESDPEKNRYGKFFRTCENKNKKNVLHKQKKTYTIISELREAINKQSDITIENRFV